MKPVNKILRVVVAAGMMLIMAPSTLRAESAVPDPGSFFASTSEFDPNASGTKYSGTLTIAYVLTDTLPCASHTVGNMYVVLTLQQGNNMLPFNTDFTQTPTTAPFCFEDTPSQIKFVLDLIRNKAIPHFYGNCIPVTLPGSTCPKFLVKALSNFASSGTGAVSTNITIAVQ